MIRDIAQEIVLIILIEEILFQIQPSVISVRFVVGINRHAECNRKAVQVRSRSAVCVELSLCKIIRQDQKPVLLLQIFHRVSVFSSVTGFRIFRQGIEDRLIYMSDPELLLLRTLQLLVPRSGFFIQMFRYIVQNRLGAVVCIPQKLPDNSETHRIIPEIRVPQPVHNPLQIILRSGKAQIHIVHLAIHLRFQFLFVQEGANHFFGVFQFARAVPFGRNSTSAQHFNQVRFRTSC